MNPSRTLRLGLMLAVLGGTASAATDPEPVKQPQILQVPPVVVEPALPDKLPRARPGARVRPEPGIPSVYEREPGSVDNRVEGWQDLPPVEAYGLFKDLGLEIPRDLALQVNASLAVNPYDPADRQAGGCPGTALTIPDTGIGDSYQDAGTTVTRANYIGNVPNYTGSCYQSGNFLGNDVWYTFTLATSTTVLASTCEGGTNYDSLLGLFTPDLVPLAISDDDCSLVATRSTISCCLEPGTYYLVVDGFAGASGSYDLSVDFLACAAPATGVRGGPDAFGYTWNTSSDPTGEGPDFDWFDISGETVVTLGDNDATSPIPIGFGFTYYGTTYNNVHIGSNGLVGFTGTSLGQFTNTVLPSAAIPNRMIAAFWDDLAPNNGGTITRYSDVANGRFIVQYTGVPAFPAGGLYTFQVILHRGGDIVINYWDVPENDVSEATIGIENQNGTVGLTANFNGAGWQVGDFSAIRFTHPRPTSGGPDAFGYTWMSSDDPAAPPAVSYDVGTSIGITGDDQVVDISLPFDFPFYGNTYPGVRVTSNGWIGFGNEPAYSANPAVPDPGTPNNGIYVLFDDLYPPYGGTVSRWTDNNVRTVIRWDGLHAAGHLDGLVFDFQVELYNDGRIQFNFSEVNETLLASATIGIENATGTDGLQIACNGSGCAVHDRLSIRVTPPPVPHPTRGGPGAGYAWIDDFDPAGPEWQWIEINGTGTDLGITQDDQVVVQALPFPFPWSGGYRDSIAVCSNGWISFRTDSPALWDNHPLPHSGDGLQDLLAVFWDDLEPDSLSRVLFRHSPTRQYVVVEWYWMKHVGSSDRYSFQAVLYANGEISFNYHMMGEFGVIGTGSATVGLESPDGLQGLQLFHEGVGSGIGPFMNVRLYPVERTPRAISDLRIVADGVPTAQPFAFHYEWSPVTADINGNTLEAEYYHLYYRSGLDPYAPFPEQWVFHDTFTTPYTPTLLHYADDIAVRIVAVDVDGLVLGGGSPAGAPPVTAESLRARARVDDGTVLRRADGQPLK